MRRYCMRDQVAIRRLRAGIRMRDQGHTPYLSHAAFLTRNHCGRAQTFQLFLGQRHASFCVSDDNLIAHAVTEAIAGMQ